MSVADTFEICNRAHRWCIGRTRRPRKTSTSLRALCFTWCWLSEVAAWHERAAVVSRRACGVIDSVSIYIPFYYMNVIIPLWPIHVCKLQLSTRSHSPFPAAQEQSHNTRSFHHSGVPHAAVTREDPPALLARACRNRIYTPPQQLHNSYLPCWHVRLHVLWA